MVCGPYTVFRLRHVPVEQLIVRDVSLGGGAALDGVEDRLLQLAIVPEEAVMSQPH